jgi:zinc/manganese transport system substrate-binding protein
MMRLLKGWLTLLVVFAASTDLGPGPAGSGAAGKVQVVATIPDLKLLTEAVGGDLVEVDSLARGSQNPHDLEVRPSLMVKVRRADALVVNGLELDQWAERVVIGAANPRVVPGAPGLIDASQGVPVLEVPTTRVDRSMGDVHPLGNPHYTSDPGLMPIVTANIAAGLARIAPEHRAQFGRNREQFLGRLEQAQARWSQALAPAKGAKVVTYHSDYIYLLTRFGLSQAGAVEDRPGIPPSPAHLAQLIQRMKAERVKAVLVEPWSDQKLAARVAQEAGAQAVTLPPTAGAVSGARSYIDGMDAIVSTLAQALR